MQLILNLANGVAVTATPTVAADGTVSLALHADTPVGPLDLTGSTTRAAVRAMLAAGKGKFGPRIAAYLNRVLGMHGAPPLPLSTSPIAVDVTGGTTATATDDTQAATAPRNPLAGLTGVGEGSASAGLWAYGPYAVTVPVSYRVLRPWPGPRPGDNRLPWWWPKSWAWQGPLYPLPGGGGYLPYPPRPTDPQWNLPWYLRTDAAGPQDRPFAARNPGAGGSPSPSSASIGRGGGGGGGRGGGSFGGRNNFGVPDPWGRGGGGGPQYWYGQYNGYPSIGADGPGGAPIAAAPVGTIPATTTNGLVANPVPQGTLPWFQRPLYPVPPAPPVAATNYQSGFALGQAAADRARREPVYVDAWVTTAGARYYAGYQAGVAAAGGTLQAQGTRTRVVPPARAWTPPAEVPSSPRGGSVPSY